MSTNGDVQSFEEVYAHLGGVAIECLDAIEKGYGLSRVDAVALFEHAWIHAFGIGALCAPGIHNFSEKPVSKMLTQDFTAMMMLIQPDGGLSDKIMAEAGFSCASRREEGADR